MVFGIVIVMQDFFAMFYILYARHELFIE